MSKAVYPGSFDPTTNGHIDIIKRASCFVDTLVVAVLENPSKNPLFSVEERVEHIKMLTSDLKNVCVMPFSGLLADFVKDINANFVIRGVRTITDFEYEFQMALTNRSLNKNMETLFIPASTKVLYLSSSVVKEVAMFGGDISDMVPEKLKNIIVEKFEDHTKWFSQNYSKTIK